MLRYAMRASEHKRIEKFFLRDDISKSIADRALKLSHELDNCINIYNPEDQVSTGFSFPVVAFVLTLPTARYKNLWNARLFLDNGGDIIQ